MQQTDKEESVENGKRAMVHLNRAIELMSGFGKVRKKTQPESNVAPCVSCQETSDPFEIQESSRTPDWLFHEDHVRKFVESYDKGGLDWSRRGLTVRSIYRTKFENGYVRFTLHSLSGLVSAGDQVVPHFRHSLN